MNSPEMAALNEKCGFFDIGPPDGFKVLAPNDAFNRIVGRNAEGVGYIELVCPEDRDAVQETLQDVYEQGQQLTAGRLPRACGSIRHRIILPDDSVITVALTFGYSRNGTLACSVIQAFETFSGDTLKKYKSNNVLESFAVSMAVVDISDDGHFFVKHANSDFYRMIGWSRVEFKEMFNNGLGDDVIVPEDFDAFRKALLSLNEEERECVFETRVTSVSGGFSVNEVRARYLYAENKRPMISLAFVDVTERNRLRKEMLIKNERFNIIQTQTDQLVFDYDTEKDRCVFSGDLSRAEKYLPMYEIDRKNRELVVDDFFASRFALGVMGNEDYDRFCEAFADAIIYGLSGEVDFVLGFIGQSAGLWYGCTFSTVKDDMGTVVRIVGRLKNIDKQKKSELMMEKRVYNDTLTGLLNKDTAMNKIRLFLENEARDSDNADKYHALIIIDMDNFRMINEVFGHTFGDDVIREFASDIKSSFRDTDIVGRIGGDEFMILMKDVTQKFATKKAGRLCRGLVKRYGAQNVVTVSCSIGVAFYGKDAHDFYELYQHADLAMYQAKVNGRSAYNIYDGTMDDNYRRMEEAETRSGIDQTSDSVEISELDTNLMDIAFSLMASSDDIDGTLEILLRTVGRKYNLSAVSVLVETDRAAGKLCAMSRWISNKNLEARNKPSPMELGGIFLDQIFRGADVKCVSDMGASNLPSGLRGILKNDGIISCVWGRLEGHAGEGFGCIMFTQFDRKRKWSRKEINTFKYITKILSVTIAKTKK